MQILDKIAFSKTEPSTDCLWIKPVTGGVAIYIFDGHWKALELVNDMGTASTDDDALIDVKNIPSLESLEQKIRNEVAEQVAEYDSNVKDTHYTETSDLGDYPETTLFG